MWGDERSSSSFKPDFLLYRSSSVRIKSGVCVCVCVCSVGLAHSVMLYITVTLPVVSSRRRV